MSTYSYSPPVGGVFTAQKDEVRFLLNDTTPSAPYSVSDEEIQYLLVQAGNDVYQAASRAARRMATAYAKSAGSTKRVGNLALTKDAAAQAAAYNALAEELASGDGDDAPMMGNAIACDGPGPFWERQFDNPEAGGSGGQHYDVFAHPLYEEG
jgi:hypothetical protein